jgi:hypothetical protein
VGRCSTGSHVSIYTTPLHLLHSTCKEGTFFTKGHTEQALVQYTHES